MKFKVGDEVICRTDLRNEGEYAFISAGTIGIITGINYSHNSIYPILVYFSSVNDAHLLKESEIVLSNKFFRRLYGVRDEI